jgi:glycosyltransferase involved in cell wall biosynthesis
MEINNNFSVASGEYLVSAIVSTYNAERFIRGRLEDLLAQSIAKYLEIIVIDSGSQQNERCIIEDFQKRYQNIRYIRTEQRETIYQAWNRGIRLATGEFLCNANADDRLRYDCIETLVQSLRENPECVLAYSDILYTEEENSTFEKLKLVDCAIFPPHERFSLLYGCNIQTAPLWRRSLHTTFGYFDERYRSAADYEFWLRISRVHDMLHVPQFLVLCFKSQESVSEGLLSYLECLQVQKEYVSKFAHLIPPSDALQPEELEKFSVLAAGASLNSSNQLTELEAFSQLNPDFAMAHHYLGELYFKNNNMQLARESFLKAVILEPHTQRYQDSLNSFLKLHLFSIFSHHEAAALSDASHLESRLCDGMTCILLDRYESAYKHYQQAFEIDPENPLVTHNLAAVIKQLEIIKNTKVFSTK